MSDKTPFGVQNTPVQDFSWQKLDDLAKNFGKVHSDAKPLSLVDPISLSVSIDDLELDLAVPKDDTVTWPYGGSRLLDASTVFGMKNDQLAKKLEPYMPWIQGAATLITLATALSGEAPVVDPLNHWEVPSQYINTGSQNILHGFDPAPGWKIVINLEGLVPERPPREIYVSRDFDDLLYRGALASEAARPLDSYDQDRLQRLAHSLELYVPRYEASKISRGVTSL